MTIPPGSPRLSIGPDTQPASPRSAFRPRSSIFRRAFLALLLFLLTAPLLPLRAQVPSDARQLIVAVTDDWDTFLATLWRFERTGPGANDWRVVGGPVPAVFGKNGMAWGRGVSGQGLPGKQKQERDGRTPAGIFALGRIYTMDPALPPGSNYPFYRVTEADAWPDDPNNPSYNRLVTIPDPAQRPPWWKRQRMKTDDWAYRWLVEIRHNSDPIVPGAGSAIFFHIRRGPHKPSSGCTTMAVNDLVSLVRWVRAEARPHYVALPRREYAARQAEWRLPALPAERP